MTRLYLHATFNEPIGPETCAQLKAFGWDGVRVDVQRAPEPVALRCANEALDAGLAACVVVADERQVALLRGCAPPDRLSFELRNEPDIEGPSPLDYAHLMQRAAAEAGVTGHRLYVGALSNPHGRGRDYWRRIESWVRDAPPHVGVSWHRYGAGTWQGEYGETWARPHEGFATRDEELWWVHGTAGGRPLAITECGWSTAPRCWGWWIFKRCRRYSEADVWANLAAEISHWARADADFVTLYQLNDGPDDTRLNRYGIRRADGSWKPLASAPLSK